MLAAAVAAGVTGSARAQSAPPDEQVAAPLIGQVFLNNSPLSPTVADNQPRFTLVPSLSETYNTNVLGYVLVRGARDNVRTTPGIDLDYRRLFGRVAVSVSGSGGYDFNSRFSFLNQSRIHLDGTARAPVGATCGAKTEVTFDKLRFDPGNTQAAVGSASTTQTYDVLVNCQRLEGFSPVVEGTYRSLDTSQSLYLNYKQYVEVFGIAYTQPSLGTATLSGAAVQLRRPGLMALFGFSDDTNVYSGSFGLNRSISPRLQFNVAAGVSKADPQRSSVRGFFGPSFNGQIQWLPTPRFVFTGTAVRAVTNQNGVAATYIIRTDYTLSASWEASAKSGLSLNGGRTERNYRGEDSTPNLLPPIHSDQTTSVSGRYNYNLTRKLRLGLTLSHVWRRADPTLYNYSATIASSSIGARF